MISKAKETIKKLEFGFLEIFVGFFMIIGLVGYFGSLPADLDWIDHTFAFLMFSYFFYILNITSILFGKTSKLANLLLVMSYFSFFFKGIVAYTEANAFKFEVIRFVDNFYLFFNNNLALTNLITFYIGIFGVFVASLYITKKITVSSPSFLHMLHKSPFKSKLAKFSFVFVTLLAFYYLIYNPILEWLEFVLDDPIVLVGIIYYATKIAKHHRKFHERHLVFKVGDLVWGWYNKFISLFHYKKTLPLAISGLLVLHALSDLGVFAYSLVFFKENFYLEFLSGEHVPFLKLFLGDVNNMQSTAVISLFIIYLLNALSLIIFFLIPLIVWVKMFSQKEFHFGRIFLFFIYSSAAAYMLLPGYVITPLSEISIAGVDIMSVSILETSSLLDNFFPNKTSIVIAVSLTSIIFGLAVYVLSSNAKIKRELYAISIIGGLTFYAIYLYYFFSSLLIYFYDSIALTIFTPHFLVGIILAIFLLLSAVFYIGGYTMFLYEIVMEYHKRKWSEPIDEELVIAIKKIKGFRKMLRPRKAQIIGEVFKYALVGLVSVVVLVGGYKAIGIVKDRACKTELAKFEIDLRDIDKSVRFGAKEMQSYDVPCKMDEIYFFDLSKNAETADFIDIPIIKDSLESDGSDNVFLVREEEVKKSFYAGNLRILYPHYKCLLPKFGKISFFIEGSGAYAKMESAAGQPECTFKPVEIEEEEAKEIVEEAADFACPRCPLNPNEEKSKIEQTAKNVNIFRNFEIKNKKTTVKIKLRVKEGKKLINLNYYESIPKECVDDLGVYLLERVGEGAEIAAKDDPLIVWHFDELKGHKGISYKLDKELTSGCRELIKGLAVAQAIEEEEIEEEEEG